MIQWLKYFHAFMDQNNLLVIKFGGVSFSTPDNFQKIASIVLHRKKSFSHVVVVVSAMRGMTDYLLSLANAVHPSPPIREMDMLVSVGERVSMSLLAMTLNAMGYQAVSFTGSQSGIITCRDHSCAKILDVRPTRVSHALLEGKIPIIAGFQGVSQEREITTLGRGGSDTTAVALGVALRASHVEMYKDVGGFFDHDPKFYEEAKKISYLDFSHAYQLSCDGAKVINSRAIALAQKNCLPIWVASFLDFFPFSYEKGSWIGKKTFEKVEKCVYEVEGVLKK